MGKKEIHQRLIQAFESLRNKGILHTQSEFSTLIGVRIAHLNNAMNGDETRLTLGLMKKIADAFPDILNRDYLLTGEGDVAAPDKSLRPHYDAKACAGFMCDVAEGENGTMRPAIPGMRDYDFTIEAQGDSMMPRIESGDLLVCRKSDDNANPPMGKICVIDGKNGAVVKVITAVNDESITLHSLNPVYKDYDVEFSDILGIAEVVGLVRTL